MKPHWLILAVLVLAISAGAKDKHDKPVPLSSTDIGLKITKVELDQARITQLAQQYQTAMNQLQEKFQADSAQLADLQKQAFADQKLSEQDYTFNLVTLTFTPKVAPKDGDKAQDKGKN